jgi:sucrose phosphorylase
VKLIELIKFRNTHPAFNGKFLVGNCDDQTIDLSWISEDLFARLVVSLQPLSASIVYKDPNEKDTQTIIL